MKKINQPVSIKAALLLILAAILLLASTVGSTRAALTYYSESYSAQLNMSNIGVSLVENGEIVSSRNYTEDGVWDETGTKELLSKMVKENEKFQIGKKYEERISVRNTGSIAAFVRVTLTKSWTNDEMKDITMSPDLILLNLLSQNGWVVDTDASTKERTVLYYTNALEAGSETPPISDTFQIDPEVAKKWKKAENGNTISYVYEYNGYVCKLEAEVDAVQTHNGGEAIKSAWGVDVTVSDDESSMSLR
ncbi:MAG: hypothetical protein PHC41_03695 [Lachnospiraceae bacterium]|nr:hypothetical protein [Lachnospiraceae bacterium]MDD3615311.1 hypothetical protein [Lachnospiraceae bacterium]